MNKYIIIEPYGGLANRMRVIASAITISKKTNCKLIVIWNNNEECGCNFYEIFAQEKIPAIIININNSVSYYFLKIFRKVILLLSNYPHVIKLLYLNQQDIVDKKANITELKKYKITHIQTCSEFNKGEYRFFSPQKQLKKLIFKNINKDTIGIHIRRGDNKKSIIFSPTKLFTKTINEEINNNNNSCQFYLSTDDKKEEDNLVSEFKSKILSYSKRSYDRNSKEAIQDAVIDLFSLSNCNKILASYWSSFSEVASRLKNIPITVVRIQQDTPADR